MSATPLPMASLSSGLLARKGQARPAMRHAAHVGAASRHDDDLGWNDMGAEPLAPSEGEVPPVLVQRDRLVAAVDAPQAVQPIALAAAQRIGRETQQSGRTAFTIRVDGDRHLRLRLAAAITHRSAQDLVAEALDVLLAAVPEVEALVAQLPHARTRP